MLKTSLALVALMLVVAHGPAAVKHDAPAPQTPQADESVIPLEGLDPVLLTRGQEKQGDEQFFVKRGHFRYLFASAETKAAFEREPALYEIQLDGSCARMGPSVRGNPDLYLVHKGRIYIFGSPDCVTAFKAKPESYLDSESPEPAAPATEEALRRGRALVERAVEAAGGAARVDGVKSYVETATAVTPSPNGAREIKTKLTAIYPDSVRVEQTFPFGTVANVLTRGGGFFIFPRGGSEMNTAQRDAADKQFKTNLLSLLRARRGEDFKAVALGAGGAAAEQVEVSYGGVRARLGLDPSTGRVLSLSFRGRAPGGEIGQIVHAFSDYRAAGGLTLPFKTVETFGADTTPLRTLVVESIVINGEVAPSLFERPKPSTARQ